MTKKSYYHNILYIFKYIKKSIAFFVEIFKEIDEKLYISVKHLT